MSFFAVLFALLIEQLKPLRRGNRVQAALAIWYRWTARNFDAGLNHHAWIAWCIAVALPSILAGAVFIGLHAHSSVFAFAWSVLLLYLTLGFRQFSHNFTDIRQALDEGDELRARQLLANWQQLDASELSRADVLRLVLEHALISAHRHVFGVFFLFVIFAALGLGPAGAVLYRLADYASRRDAFKPIGELIPVNPRLETLATKCFSWIDYLPVRFTAFGFAVVGNFEEAINCWRQQTDRNARESTDNANESILLAAAAGAMGVRFEGSTTGEARGSERFESAGTPSSDGDERVGGGAKLQLGHLGSVVGLIWRSVVLWMCLLALLSLANLVG